MSQTPTEDRTTAPPYVQRLMDALLRHVPIDFQGEPVPDDVRERLEAYFASQKELHNKRGTDFTDAHMQLIGRIAEAVALEFERSLGIHLGASRDDTWLKAGDGGWYHEEGERAHMFVRADLYPTPPDDGRDWHPAYVLAPIA
jgi:hypothetical protein